MPELLASLLEWLETDPVEIDRILHDAVREDPAEYEHG